MNTTSDNQITAELRKSLALVEATTVTEDMISPADVGYKRWATRTIAGLMQKVAISNAFLKTALDEFEARFDHEKQCDSPAIAEWYIEAASYMEEKFSRSNHRISDVQNWYDNA